jgi:hypothetical protein
MPTREKDRRTTRSPRCALAGSPYTARTTTGRRTPPISAPAAPGFAARSRTQLPTASRILSGVQSRKSRYGPYVAIIVAAMVVSYFATQFFGDHFAITIAITLAAVGAATRVASRRRAREHQQD